MPVPSKPIPRSGKYYWPLNPRKVDVVFLDPEYFNGIKSPGSGSSWLVPPGYWHTGVDLNNPSGGNSDCGQSVHAITDGQVILAQKLSGSWGKVLVIWHPGPGVWTRSAHLTDFRVQKGDVVQAGQVVGTVGRMATGGFCHLHFDVFKKAPADWNFFPRNDKEAVQQYCTDPLAFLNKVNAENPPYWVRGGDL